MRRSCFCAGRSASTVARTSLALVITFSTLALVPDSGAGAGTALEAPENLQSGPGVCSSSTVPPMASRIGVYWSPYTFPGAALHHYNLYRDGALFAQPRANSYADTPPPGEYHSYTVSAVDVAGRESPRTGHTSAIAFDCTHTPARVGELRVAVLLVNRPGTSKDAAADAVFGHASDVYREASWGQTWLTGDVFGPYPVKPGRKCDMSAVISDARQAAGITHNEYDHFLVFGAGCGSWAYLGLGAFVGNPTVAAHELGHVLGMLHARSSSCSVAALNDRSCTTTGNGSRFDFMGGTRELNAPHKDRLGWLNMGGRSQLLDVSQSGTYEIAPLNVAPKPGETTPHALRFVTGPTTVPSYRQPQNVYVEFRQVKPGQPPQGVLMTHSAPTVYGYHGQLSEGRNHFLTRNGSYSFKPGSRLPFPRDDQTVTIEVQSVTSDRAVVQVTVT